jgi:hypothetical protein
LGGAGWTGKRWVDDYVSADLEGRVFFFEKKKQKLLFRA